MITIGVTGTVAPATCECCKGKFFVVVIMHTADRPDRQVGLSLPFDTEAAAEEQRKSFTEQVCELTLKRMGLDRKDAVSEQTIDNVEEGNQFREFVANVRGLH